MEVDVHGYFLVEQMIKQIQAKLERPKVAAIPVMSDGEPALKKTFSIQ